MNFPEIEHLASSIDKLAAALGDKGAAALMREQKWNTEAAPLQHPDEAPAPVQQPSPVSVPTVAPGAPVQQDAPIMAPQPVTVPTSAKTYSIDDLAKAAAQLMDAGKQNELIGLLNNQFKVQALTQLPQAQFGAFATALRQLGAQL
jgi:hypothetical protein